MLVTYRLTNSDRIRHGIPK